MTSASVERHEHHGRSPVAVRFVTVGDELLSGDTVDTNSAFMGERCRELGLDTICAVSVRDRIHEIAAAVRDAAQAAQVCLVSGGLGPTADDVTAAAVALASGRPLQRQATILADIEAKFRAFGRPMAAMNCKQADLPEGATWLPNPVGSAPGFLVEVGECQVFVMPGVPWELRKMMREQVEPRLRERWPLAPWPRRMYRLLGRGESSIATDVEAVVDRARARSAGLAALTIHYRANFPEVRVVLEATRSAQGHGASAEELASFDQELISVLGPALYGLGEADLAPRVIRAATNAGLHLTTAESCTAGGVAKLLGAIPGASSCWRGSIVAYDNAVKTRLLGVDPEVIQAHGAVSEAVAVAMAHGARTAMAADLAVGVTGIAGPGGGNDEKPVGTVHIAVSDRHGVSHERLSLRGNRGRVQRGASAWALKLLWDRLVDQGHAHIEVFD